MPGLASLPGSTKAALEIKNAMASKSSRRGTPDKRRGSVGSVARLALAKA